MASYLQNVNPQSFISNPYVLPAQQITQAIATRNAYWDAGASQLKNAQQHYLNLSLSRPDNKEQLNNLMKDVNNGLKRASQMDLSIAPNVNDAMKVFDPIVKNENIMGDHAITQHYQKEFQNAEAFKVKDGGKGYNQANVRYMSIGMEEFANDPSASNWRKHYAQRRTYLPYHDVQAEIRDLMKNFKPSVTSQTLPGKGGGYYLESKTDKSAYSNQIKAYLSANLSDKARTQLGINGAVAYHNRPDMLVNDYQDFTSNKLTALTKQGNALKGIIDATKDEELKALYKDQLSEIEVNIDDLTTEYNKLKAGDRSVVEQDYDQKAGLIYSDNYINNLAKANERLDVDVTFKPDTAALTFFRENMENMRLDKSIASRERLALFNAEADFAKIRLASDLKAKEDGTALTWDDYTMSSDTDSQVEFSKSLFDNQLNQSKANVDQSTKLLMENLRAEQPDIDKWPEARKQAFIETWAKDKNNQSSPVYQNYLHNFNVYNNQKAAHDQIVNEAVAEAKRLYPDEFKQGAVHNRTVTVTDMNGRKSKITVDGEAIRKSTMGQADLFEIGTIDSAMGPRNVLKYNGQTYYVDTSDFVDLKEAQLTAETNSTQKVRDIVSAAVTKSRQIQKPDGDQFKVPRLIKMRQGFATAFGLDHNAMADITVYGRDQFGTYFNLPTSIDEDHLGVTRKSLKQQVEAKGGRVVTVEGRPLYFIPESEAIAGAEQFYTNPQLKPIQGYFDYKKAGSPNTSVAAPDAINYDPNNIGESFTFRMDVISGKPIYYPIHRNTKKKIGPSSGFESLEDADIFLKTAFPTKQAFDNGIKAY